MRNLIFLAAALAATPALANDVDPFGFEREHRTAGTLTRAEVQALVRTPAPLSLAIDDQGRVVTTPSTRPRAEVAEDARAYVREGHRFGELGAGSLAAEGTAPLRMADKRAADPASTTR